MKVHVLQHAPFEGLASIASWLAARKAEVNFTRFFEDATLPSLQGLDLVIAMGGPMSVNDEAALPWLREEKRFIREAVARGTPVLGVCLGSQLIASALGARIYPNRQKEIGWFPLEAVGARGETFHFPEKFRSFHWHGETFDLPRGALQLARSAACENQAFQVGRRTLALQFHLEVTPEAVRAFVDHCGSELKPAPYIQSAEEITKAAGGCYDEINRLMERVLNYLIEP
jgi:GMP synthase-like glutamine amidotransferase